MSLPKISIVTPSYNQRPFIEQTIRSVLDQNYPNLEYVIIDGQSNDGSGEVIRRYADRIAYWVSEPDEGHGDALNKGFRQTTGEIMGWINSDDKYMPWTFEVVAEIFSTFPDVNWIVGTHSWWDANGRLFAAHNVHKNIYDFLLGDFAWIQQESVFWRRNMWERAGGHINEKYKFMVDGELWSRFFLLDNLYSVNCVIGGYRTHGTNRAKLHYAQCLSEMNNAIGKLRADCSPAVLRNYRRLKVIKAMRKVCRTRYCPIHKMARKLFPALHNETAYDTIELIDGKWCQLKKPFLR